MYIQRRVDPLGWNQWFRGFDELFQDYGRAPRYRAPVRSSITEEEEYFLLRVELPGFTEKDVRVNFDAGVLTISAEATRDTSDKEKDEKSQKAAEAPERSASAAHSEVRLSRSFELGDAIDPEQITAEMRAGVLTVRLPKHSRTKPRQIAVRAA